MLFKNDIFEHEEKEYRLLYAEPENNFAWVIDTTNDLAWPIKIHWYAVAHLHAVPTNKVSLVIAPTNAMMSYRDKAFTRIQPLIEQTPDIYFSFARGQMVQARAMEVGCSVRTLYKDLRRWFQGGETTESLLANFNNSGQRISGNTANRGKTPRNTILGERAYGTYQLHEKDLAIFKRHIESAYLKDQRVTKTDAYQRLLEKHYSTVDGNGDLFINHFGCRPTYRQFSHYLQKKFPLEMQLRGRKGNKEFELGHRQILGTVGDDCRGVGHYYEIDATIVDVFLVSSVDPEKIIGKPTLYLIFDRKSRLIVGFYCGLENASWAGAMQAILSIAQDKQALCKSYGVSYSPEDWPAHQVFPREFLADRGEMISRNSNNVCDGLLITVTNLPAKRPDWKPIVECGFKLTQESLKAVVTAYDPPSNATKRQGKKYYKDACLTLKDFVAVIIETIKNHNAKAMPDYELDLAEINTGVLPTPINLWNNNIPKWASNLTRYSELQVRHALLPKDKARVTTEGILFQGCYYTCPEAQQNGWFVDARNKGRFSVTVSFDSRLVDSILIHSPKDGNILLNATLTSRSKKYEGLSFAEVKYFEKLIGTNDLLIKQSRHQTTFDYHQKVDPIVSNAKKRYRNKAVGTARRADIANERENERRIERQDLASTQENVVPNFTTPNNVISLPVKFEQNIKTKTSSSSLSSTELTPEQKAQEMRRKMLNGY